MLKDPNEWENLALGPDSVSVLKRFRAAGPQKQVPLSPVSTYTINEYWRKKVGSANK